jgi:peroxiredoxin
MGDSLGGGRLAIGDPAPEFELPDQDGVRRALDEWRGRPVRLLFFDPAARACRDFEPVLGEVPPAAGADPAEIVIMSRGDPLDNLRIVRAQAIRVPYLLDETGEVAARYGATSAPLGYSLDSDARIADGPVGAVRDIVTWLGLDPDDAGLHALLPALATTAPRGIVTRPLSESAIPRDGLAPGVPAPAFELPRIGGGRIGPADFAGRAWALVFSDPFCVPCAGLTGELEALYRQSSGRALLMVSRSGLETNQAMIAAYDVTYPVAVQRYWEVSRQYARLATPVAYVIDAHGNIAAPPAFGVGEVLQLAGRALAADDRRA